MGVSSVLKPHKELASLAEIFRAQNGSGDNPLFCAVQTTGPSRNSLRKDKSIRKEHPKHGRISSVPFRKEKGIWSGKATEISNQLSQR